MFVLFHWILSLFEVVISLMGVAIVLVGVVRAGCMLLPVLLKKPNLQSDVYKDSRFLLAQYILLGLEFMVASDVIYTVLARDYESLIVLVGLVVVRTVLVYSLGRETAQNN
jgi:uncharacterized membrane protein